MAIFTGFTPASDYGCILNVGVTGGQVGLTNVLQQIQDAYGNPTPLSISTIAFNIARSGFVWSLDGTAVIAQAVDINSMCQPNPVALGTAYLTLPVGTTADRPIVPSVGMERYNTDLGAFEGYTGSGWQEFPSGSFVTSVAGTANRITVTGSSAVTIDIAATYVGQTSITTLGTVGTGTWQATPVTEVYGGTHQSSYILGDTLYASGANTLSKLAGNTTSGIKYMSQTGTGVVSAAPAWATISGGDITGAALTKTDDTNVTLTLGGTPTTALLRATSLTLGWTGTLSSTRGGLGVSNPTAHGILVAEGASAVNPIVLSSGQILIGSTGADPVAAAINSGTGILVGNAAGSITVTNTGVTSLAGTANQITASASTGGVTLSIPSTFIAPGSIAATTTVSGTTFNSSTLTASSVVVSDASKNLVSLTTANSAVLLTTSAGVPVMSSTMTNGQVIIGSTGATPVAASLTAGTGVTITPGAGTITIAATGSGGTVTNVSGVSPIASTGGATPAISLNGTATAGQVLQSASATTTAYSTPTYPSASGTAGKILRSDGTNNVYSTSTFADTYAASTLLYSNGANTVTGLATANSAVLLTTSAGVPVYSSTMTNGQIIIGSTGATPVAASLTAGTNITITPGAGTITIAAAGGSGGSVAANGYRLSLTSGLPVTTTDVTGATTLYLVPYKGYEISLYSGSAWVTLTPGQISITNSGLSATTTYDVFVDYNGGTPQLSFTAWSSSTPGSGSRATALTYQNGVLVKNGTLTSRYVGTIYTNGSTQFTDSFANRLTYNYYNRVSRSFGLLYTASSWGQANNNTWEIFNNSGSSANIVVGVQEDNVYITVEILATGSGPYAIGVGVNSGTVNSATINNSSPGAGGGGYPGITAHYTGIPTLGYQYYCPLEYGPTASMGYYTNQVATSQSGLTGAVMM